MPHVTLAAVVIAYSIGLVDPTELAAIRRVRTMEFRWAVFSCLGVMMLGTLKGIMVAIVFSLVDLIRMSNDTPVDTLGRIPGSRARDGAGKGGATKAITPGSVRACSR
jgi:SulP family sulfate permease